MSTTENAHVVPTLARWSWTLPWLTILAISAAVACALTVFLVSAQSVTLPAASSAATTQTFTISPACDDTPDNFLVVYARTTGRVPANYCPAAR